MPKKHHSWRVRGNSLQLRFSGGTDIHGKRIQKTRTVSDINPATGRHLSNAMRDRLWEEFAAECRRANYLQPSSLTVRDICNYHIEVSTDLSPNTVHGYRNIIKKYIPARLLDSPAYSINRAAIKQWISYLSNEYITTRGKHLSPKTIRNAFGFLSTCFQTAVQDELLADNPCRDIPLPKVHPTPAAYLSADEAIVLVRALQQLPEHDMNSKCFILLCLMCGLRRGEVTGLNEEDIDFNARTITIQRARYHTRDGCIEKDPKSYTSIRTVALPSLLSAELHKLILWNKKQRMALGSQWLGGSTLIRNTMGGPLHPVIVYRKLSRLLEENELPHMGLHGLRHTYASSLVGMNLDIKTVSTQLGHADVNITNRYIHQFEEKSTKIANAIDEIYTKLG